jgi:hypothetical protein
LVIVWSSPLRFTTSDYPFGIFRLFLSFLFWSLYFLSFFYLRLLIIPLVSSNFSCPYNDQKRKDKKSLKIPKGVIRSRKSKRVRPYNDQKRKDKPLVIVWSVPLLFTTSDYYPLWYLQTFLVLSLLVIVWSSPLLFTTSDYYPLWYLQTFLVLSLLVIVWSSPLLFTTSDYYPHSLKIPKGIIRSRK